MSLKQIDLTTALRPSLSPDEVLLFVQDNVGLYEGYAESSSTEECYKLIVYTVNIRYQSIKMGMST